MSAAGREKLWAKEKAETPKKFSGYVVLPSFVDHGEPEQAVWSRRDRKAKFEVTPRHMRVPNRPTRYQSRTQWEIMQEFRRIQREKKIQQERASKSPVEGNGAGPPEAGIPRRDPPK